jgi:hypothetical protein
MNQNKLKRQSNVETEFAYDNLTAALDQTVQAAVALGVSEREVLERLSQSFSKNANACQSNIVPIMVPPARKMYDSSAGP